jgi:hypothetical protein
MPRTECNVQVGKNRITDYLAKDADLTKAPFKVNAHVFQEVSVGKFPKFVFRCGADRKDDAVTFSPAPSKPSTQEGEPPSTVELPVLSYELKVSIPQGMRIHQSLLPKHGEGTLMVNSGVNFDAALLPVLERPLLDTDGPEFKGRQLGINHFCTDKIKTGSSSSDLNCHQLMQALPLVEEEKENQSAENYICASLPLRAHLKDNYLGEDNERARQSEFYQYFEKYLHPDAERIEGSSYGDRVYMIGSYLPNHTVVWFPIFQEQHEQVHNLLLKVGRDTVFSSDQVFYVDSLDIFLTKPEQKMTYLKPKVESN